MASVSLKNVYKIYDGGVTAVTDFNLEIADEDVEKIVTVGDLVAYIEEHL